MDVLTDVVNLIVLNLCDVREDVNVQFLDGDNGLYINIIVNDDDKRKIIGKKGGNIQALRTIVHSIAARDNIKTYVTLIE